MELRSPLAAAALSACLAACGPAPEAGEHDRIQAHFDSVLAELRTAPGQPSSARRTAARAQSIAWLEEYRDAGIFPHNHVSGSDVPIFVDPHGRACAVAYLILRSGHDALVERVVRHDNLALVPELAGNADLAAWLEERGLTLEEAARIQVPGYVGRGTPEPAPTPAPTYGRETVGLAVLSAAAASYGEMAPRTRASRLAGWLNGAALVGHGALATAAARSSDAAAWEVGVNLAGVALGATMLWRRLSGDGPRAEAHADGAVAAVASPIVEGGRDGSLRLGMSLRH